MNQSKPNQISAWPILRWNEAVCLFRQLIQHQSVEQKDYLGQTVAIASKRLANKMLEIINRR